jgi:hypothetical protein
MGRILWTCQYLGLVGLRPPLKTGRFIGVKVSGPDGGEPALKQVGDQYSLEAGTRTVALGDPGTPRRHPTCNEKKRGGVRHQRRETKDTPSVEGGTKGGEAAKGKRACDEEQFEGNHCDRGLCVIGIGDYYW